MSDLRQAAQQALEALECPPSGQNLNELALAAYKTQAILRAALEALETGLSYPNYHPMLEGLRAALAEPVLNPAPGYCKHCKQYTIEEPLPAEPVQEPVGVVTSMVKGGVTWHRWPSDMPDGTKLYAAPPQRLPLTDEEVKAMWESHRAALPRYLCFARAIERAHGIGGSDE